MKNQNPPPRVRGAPAPRKEKSSRAAVRNPPKRKWSRDIKTASTFPPAVTFTKSGEEVARIMARKDVSPGGIGSAIRMVQMFINRAGRKLDPERREELEQAKRILQDQRDREAK